MTANPRRAEVCSHLDCNYQNNHNSIRKKCGQYTLRDLNNTANNECYHNFRVERRCVGVVGNFFEEGEEVFEFKSTIVFLWFLSWGERKRKKYFNTVLLNSTSLMGNLRLQTVATLMGPVLHHFKPYIAKTSYPELYGHFNNRIGLSSCYYRNMSSWYYRNNRVILVFKTSAKMWVSCQENSLFMTSFFPQWNFPHFILFFEFSSF